MLAAKSSGMVLMSTSSPVALSTSLTHSFNRLAEYAAAVAWTKLLVPKPLSLAFFLPVRHFSYAATEVATSFHVALRNRGPQPAFSCNSGPWGGTLVPGPAGRSNMFFSRSALIPSEDCRSCFRAVSNSWPGTSTARRSNHVSSRTKLKIPREWTEFLVLENFSDFRHGPFTQFLFQSRRRRTSFLFSVRRRSRRHQSRRQRSFVLFSLRRKSRRHQSRRRRTRLGPRTSSVFLQSFLLFSSRRRRTRFLPSSTISY